MSSTLLSVIGKPRAHSLTMNGALPEGAVVCAGGVALHDAADSAQVERVVGHVVAAVKVRGQDERQAHDPLDHHAGLRLQLQTQHSTTFSTACLTNSPYF